VLSAEQTPQDNTELAALDVDFSQFADDSPNACPVVLGDLLDHLADEVPGGEALSEMDLAFVRTAQVEDTRYWICSFIEPDGGEPAFATIALGPDGSVPGRHARVSRGSDKPDVTSPADQRPRLANAVECATDTLRADLCIRASGRDRDSARAPRHDSAIPIGPNQFMVRPIQICRSRASAICTARLAGSPSAVRAICVGYETPPARSPTGRGA
jgi:hypothetical protein